MRVPTDAQKCHKEKGTLFFKSNLQAQGYSRNKWQNSITKQKSQIKQSVIYKHSTLYTISEIQLTAKWSATRHHSCRTHLKVVDDDGRIYFCLPRKTNFPAKDALLQIRMPFCKLYERHWLYIFIYPDWSTEFFKKAIRELSLLSLDIPQCSHHVALSRWRVLQEVAVGFCASAWFFGFSLREGILELARYTFLPVSSELFVKDGSIISVHYCFLLILHFLICLQ